MRLLNVLAFACGVLALTGPIDRNPARPPVLHTGPRDVEKRDKPVANHLMKRDPHASELVLRRIPFPTPGPLNKEMILLGLSITFIMGARWIRERGRNVQQYFIQKVMVRNKTPRLLIIQAAVDQGIEILNRGARFFGSRMTPDYVRTVDFEPGPEAQTWTLATSPLTQDEL
ncbi:hypothetical protein E4U55_000400 [Claviceps digitariae]|nr:hypothetical protein E4U55_000400 [Claviceps digitariae]